MRVSTTSLAALGLAQLAKCDLHQLIVGTFTTDNLYTVEFDDSALTLKLLQNKTTTAASSWIALSHDKKALYGTSFSATVPTFVSYSLGNATNYTLSNSLTLGGNCSTSRAIFAVAATKPPYNVYGTPFGGVANCGGVFSVDDNGALDEQIQNYTYSSSSGVHGLALNSDNTFLYSADDTANTLWTHSVDSTTGKVTLVSSISGPATGSDPRHVTVHPTGQYLYVILEGANKVAQYTIDQSTGIPSFENVSYSLLPADIAAQSDANTLYWSDEVALSYSKNTLWTTARARSSNSTGYISAFSLSSTGAIESQLFVTATSTSGGTANAVTPSDFTDKYVALTDSSVGFVEIWTIADDNSAATLVAHLDLDDGGCCANAVWYS